MIFLSLRPSGTSPATMRLGQTLHDRGLAHGRLADEHGIVLRAAGEHLDGAADLGVAADDRIELALARRRGEVAAVFLQRLVGGLGVLAGDALVAAHLLHRGEEGAARQRQAAEDARDLAVLVLAKHGEHEVLHRDVLVLELPGLVLRADQELVEPVGDADLAAGAGAADPGQRVPARPASWVSARSIETFSRSKRRGISPALLRDQRVEEMLDIDGLVAETHRFLLRGSERGARLLGKFV